jgi:hypothetical protein
MSWSYRTRPDTDHVLADSISLHSRLTFTAEKENNNQLQLLDLTVKEHKQVPIQYTQQTSDNRPLNPDDPRHPPERNKQPAPNKQHQQTSNF